MPRVAVQFAYDGTMFDSFARQPGHRTVEGELLETLRRARVLVDARTARYEVCSRTDAGVSAWENVCAVDTSADPRGLVARCRPPPGLHLLAATRVEEGFRPRRAARSRTYRYHLVDGGRDWSLAADALALFEGEHDFRLFCRREPGVPTRRTIDAIRLLMRGGDREVEVTAQSFLWEQIRRILHAVDSVASSERSVGDVARQLEGDGRAEPPLAPEPLVLAAVDVGVPFPPPSRAGFRRVDAERIRASVRARFYAGLASRRPTVLR